MARRLLLGRAGSGKTHACLDRLVGALNEGRKALLLVPTYSQAEHLRYLLLDRAGGVSDRTVETFSSLAERIGHLRLADLVKPAVRDRIAAAALAGPFPSSAEQSGFRAEFLAAVKEIKEQAEAAESVLERARAHFPEGSRGRRLFEAFARYRENLTGPDHEDLLLRARDGLREKKPALDLLLVDGFHDFTPVEREILDLLAEGAAETVVTLPLDPDHPNNPVFATAARTADRFPGHGREPLRKNHRSRGALGELERRLFREPGEPAPGEGVEVLACASEEDEADRLARLVARAARPFRDFLLVRRSFAGLHGLYRAVFRRYGIPLRFFGPEPLGHSPAARTVVLWLRQLAGGLEPRERLQLLRSPFLLDRPGLGQIDRWTRELRENVDAELPDARPPDGRLPELFARSIGVRDALAECPDGSDEIARAHRLFTLVRDEAEAVAELPPAEAAGHLLRRIPLLRGAPPDRRHDCVYAVEALDARQWEKPVVMVAGLTADSFPHAVRQDLFLRDDERQALGDERDLHLPLRSRQEDEERYLFYVALTRASERLVLSYPAFDEEGTPRPPSPYLEEARRHLRDVEHREVALAEQYALPRDAIRRADLLPIVADGLARASRGEGSLAASLYEREAVPRADLSWPRTLELLRRRPVSAPAADYAARLSATAINDYRRCPYLFLVRRVLRVQPAREAALDPATRGTIVHLALDRCAKDPAADPAELFDRTFLESTRGFRLGLADEAQRRWMRSAVVSAATEMRGSEVVDSERVFEIAVGEVTLAGKIDRVDRLGDGELVRDYKTGRLETGAALGFEDLQLDVYLLSVERPMGAVYERLRKGDRVGFVLKELKDELPGRSVRALSRRALDERAETTRRIVAEVARAIRAGRLAVHPKDPESCTRKECEGYDLCRVVRSRWLAMRGRRET